MADVNVISQIEKIENTVISGLKDFQKATVTRIDQLYRAGHFNPGVCLLLLLFQTNLIKYCKGSISQMLGY